MANDRRVIPIKIDIERSVRLKNGGTGVLSTAISVFRDQLCLFELTMVDESDTAYTLPTSTYEYGVDDVADDGTDLITSANAQFNIAGDFEGGNADPAVAGTLSWRVTYTSGDLDTAIGSTASISVTHEVWYKPSGGTANLLFQLPLTIKNRFIDQTIP